MNLTRATGLLVLVGVVCVPTALGLGQQPTSASAPATQPATQPASQPASRPAGPPVPADVLKSVDDLFVVQQGQSLTREQQIGRLKSVLERGAAAEEKYPDARNLYLIRKQMMLAASILAGMLEDPAYMEQMNEIGRRILKSHAPREEKVQPDFFLTRMRVMESPSDKGAELIRSFVERYEATPAAGTATLYATILCMQTDHGLLAERLADRLEDEYLDEPGARGILRRMGRQPDIGRAFQAVLPRLDGPPLMLPEDLKGQVVVIDFWATWCGPCVAGIPHLKEVYEEYAGRGVEFVGISLDAPGEAEKVRAFVKQRGMDWIHTYSGMYWNDPTAKHYGVNAIPSLWVLDRDGNVVSDSARGELERILERALSRPASTQPAAQSD